MSFTQLNPPLPVHVEGKGQGYAFAVIDYGQEHNLIWVTGLTESGEIWCAPNPLVRLHGNWTMGREAHHAPLWSTDAPSPAQLHGMEKGATAETVAPFPA